MLARTLLSLVNLGALTATLAVWFAFPQYSTYALYACFAWVVIAFAVMYSAWGNRPVGASAHGVAGATAPAPAPAGAVRSVGGAGAMPPLDFCIYCAATLPAEATRCPVCGHAAARG
jgi:hypothetical protein